MNFRAKTRKTILFVCTGNTCRSPMAAALARRAALDLFPAGVNLKITSAGLAAFPGDTASPGALRVLRARGVDLSSHRASSLGPGDIEAADLVLTMTAAHRHVLCRLVPEQASKIFTLADYAGESGDVPDPIGGDDTVYRRVADRLEKLVHSALRRYMRECDLSSSAGSGGPGR